MVRKDQTVTDAIKNYNLSELTDDKKHESSIEKVFSFDKIKSLLVMERDSLKYKVYDSVEGCFLQNVPSRRFGNMPQYMGDSSSSKSKISALRKNKINLVKDGVVISADLIENGSYKAIATTTNNIRKSINFYNWQSFP